MKKIALPKAAICILLAVVALFVCAFGGILCRAGHTSIRVQPKFTYYFLVQECAETTAAAVMGEVETSGGAGYPMGESVVVACYYGEEEAERVRFSLASRGESMEISERTVPAFFLDGKNEEEAKKILGLFSAADSCARVLFCIANRLERGEIGQEEARAAVKNATECLFTIASSGYSRWDRAFLATGLEGKAMEKELLFSKDLRRMQARICMDLLSAPEFFA